MAIKTALRHLPSEAADSAKYFADRVLESNYFNLNEQTLTILLAESLIRALRDAGYPEHSIQEATHELGNQYGEQIVGVGLLMVCYIETKKITPWKPAAIASGIGIAAITLLGG